jgi:hypothetical protein
MLIRQEALDLEQVKKLDGKAWQPMSILHELPSAWETCNTMLHFPLIIFIRGLIVHQVFWLIISN